MLAATASREALQPEEKGVPLDRVSDRCVYFEKAVEFEPFGTVIFGPRMRNTDFPKTFRPQHRTATIANYRIADGLLDGSTLFIYKSGRIVQETASMRPDLVSPSGYLETSASIVECDRPVALCCNPNWRSYYHWMAQTLPAIDWTLSTSTSEMSLALPELQPWQESSLRLLGYQAAPRITIAANRLYRLPSIDYSGFLFGETPFTISGALRRTFQRMMLGNVPGRQHATERKLVYVFADDTHYGDLANQFELADALRSVGFYVFVPFGDDLSEQIDIFRQAQVIVGPHSDTMANVGFCKPGTMVCELFPQFYANACNQRIAQAAGANYWSEIFDGSERRWTADIPAVVGAAREAAARYAPIVEPPPQHFCLAIRNDDEQRAEDVRLPLDILLGQFESLGDDCEFGLVQRDVGIEPLGLMRFAGFFLPWEDRLNALVDAIRHDFDGIGELDTVHVELHGDGQRRREYMVRESAYKLLYHTFKHEGEIEPDDLRRQQARVLQFLRQKLVADLATGEKIWVWKTRAAFEVDAVSHLLNALQRHGPNRLLWVCHEDTSHPAGTCEVLNARLMRGFVAKPPEDNIFDFVAGPWFAVCRAAYEAFRKLEVAAV